MGAPHLASEMWVPDWLMTSKPDRFQPGSTAEGQAQEQDCCPAAEAACH